MNGPMLGGLVKPVTNLAEKTAKAQKIKSVKLKVKFGDKKTSPKVESGGN